jgi:GNAT superfamily N-acetyltransferase
MPGAAELRILVNPGDLDAEVGAAFLTRCFATRWTEAMYRWYLQRSFAGEPPDRLILMDGARAVAAVGVVYRRLRTQDGEVHRVGVATAGGTLPGARGRGYYARVLQAVVERSAARGCGALLGFVTAGNTSGRGLTRLGATAIPSAYLVSRNHSPGPQTGSLQLRDAEVADDWPLRAAARLRPPLPRRERLAVADGGSSGWSAVTAHRRHVPRRDRAGCRHRPPAVAGWRWA